MPWQYIETYYYISVEGPSFYSFHYFTVLNTQGFHMKGDALSKLTNFAIWFEHLEESFSYTGKSVLKIVLSACENQLLPEHGSRFLLETEILEYWIISSANAAFPAH